ncbi:hypothetical protein K458DRAFT_388919 [Lentithecium fluviatile CBS 122367]|uniref:Zn(2)-C6 fungal-type domain-containing protein n=1 Tax=Lentithecium fluviatile CBS 122367 TaxID=1168545 RepID=A0A6G1J1Q3_9PLEO|nr:hypothetical protein K458DRAFT_388919 [Lentithecium fluviatile CBS 122367]
MDTVFEKQRKRAKHTRSRKGCLVCRIRRVRCDETRPACLKCTSTGRTCEGYSVACDQAPTHVILPRTISTALSDDPLEKRSLSYFRIRTTRQFAAPFDDEFWSRLVLQVGAYEPCVRLAIVALGALHESFDEEHQGCKTTKARKRYASTSWDYACEYYSKAISTLNTHIHCHSWDGLDVSLLCCILCVGFEWLCGNYKSASVHLSSGLLILRQWAGKRVPIGAGISYSSPAGHLIRGQIAPLFMRLTIQAWTLDANRLQPIPWSPTIAAARVKKGEERSFVTAREDLYVLLSGVYLPPENFASAYPNLVLSEEMRAKSISRLKEWYDEYYMHLYPLGIDWSSTGPLSPAKLHLSLWHMLLTVMISNSHTEDQTEYDTFLPYFRHMLTLAGHIYHGPSGTTSPHPCFQIDMGIIPILYFIGSRCRDSEIRRRALLLLSADVGREGLFDGLAHARLLEEMIEVEEGSIEDRIDGNGVSAASRIYKTCEETDLRMRRMKVRFWKQGENGFGPLHVLTW